MSRNLIVLRCGRESRHWEWFDGTDRNWDLVLCPYEEIDSRGLTAPLIPGQKWHGLSELFRRSDFWRDYDYIFMPDDDILTDTATLNSFFDLCARHEVHLAAPALTADSYFFIS